MWSTIIAANSIASARFQVLMISARTAYVSIGIALAWTLRASVMSVAIFDQFPALLRRRRRRTERDASGGAVARFATAIEPANPRLGTSPGVRVQPHDSSTQEMLRGL